jgi:hypothetical protein
MVDVVECTDYVDQCTVAGVSNEVQPDNTGDKTHAKFTQVLQTFVHVDESIGGITSNVVDYESLRNNYTVLHEYLQELCTIDATALTNLEKVAMYCNAYNALMMDVIIHHNIPTSVEQVNDIWTTKFGTVAGSKVSLDNIEHNNVRGRVGNSEGDETETMMEAGLAHQIQAAGLVHACFVCASLSCPDLQPTAFQGSTLVTVLGTATKKWLENESKNPGTSDNTNAQLSKIFDWYGKDFERQENSIQAYVNKYASWNMATDGVISFIAYNWALNDANGNGQAGLVSLSSRLDCRNLVVVALSISALIRSSFA